MTSKWDVITVAAAVGCGAVGGVFFAFSALVMSGLNRLPAAHGLEAMKSINITAVRPPLMLALFGTAALCVVLAVRAITTWGDRRATLLLAGALVYLLGAIVLTIAYNVPLNNQLATLSAHAPGAAAQWHSYAHNWTIANHFRAAAGLSAAALLALALLASRSPQSDAGHPGIPAAARPASSLPRPGQTPGAPASARAGVTVTYTTR